MSPTKFHHVKTNNMHPPGPGPGPGSLKVDKDSHMIKKSSSPSPPSSSSLRIVGSTKPKPPQRHPVIIYTHSPKIIHTHPEDFMALVQKLTGLSRSEDDPQVLRQDINGHRVNKELQLENNNVKIVGNEDNESSSAITDENCGSIGDRGQVNSCSIFHPPNLNYIPDFTPNSADFLTASHPFYNYTHSLLFPTPNIKNPSSTLEVKNEFFGY